MTLVLICGAIDLSVGLGSCPERRGDRRRCRVVRYAAAGGGPLRRILAGALAGLTNGLLGAYLRLPIFIVTLGMLEVARGLAYLATDSQTVYMGAKIQAFALPIDGIGMSASFLTAYWRW